MIFALVSEMLLRNPDFLFAIEECGADGSSEYRGVNGYEAPADRTPVGGDNIIASIEMMTGQKPDFGYFDIVTPEDLAVLREIEEISRPESYAYDTVKSSRKVKKAKMVELLSKVFSSDTLLEGFFLLLDGTDQDGPISVEEVAGGMDGFADALGVPVRWEALKNDPVYVKRRDYNRLLCRYVKAALNLYGCIYVKELLDIIEEYETGWCDTEKNKGYTREEGGYRRTFVYNPEWLSVVTLREFADCCVPYSGVTLDGLLVHGLFVDDLGKETELLFEHMKELGHVPTQQDQDDFNDLIWDEIPYRVLYAEAESKEMYIPETKAEFLKYENRVETPAERKMRDYLRMNHYAEFDQYAKEISEDMAKDDADRMDNMNDETVDFLRSAGLLEEEEEGIDADGAIDMFMDMFYEINGNGPDCLDQDPMDSVHEFFDLVEDFGIVFDSLDEANKVVGLLMDIVNSTRLWTNHGYTPMELHALHPMKPGQMPTIVPGSTTAAQMLSEGRSDIEKIGFKLDLERGADEISTFSMPQGLGGPVVSGKKKIYPNDPCPCGSGLKYKKCCGRRA